MAQSAAIVGAGLMGRWHAYTARRLGIDVVAVVDPDPRKCHEVAVAAKAAHECRDISELFSTFAVDAVHVCTPLATHFELCQRSLENGSNVLCEKPLACDRRETETLVAVARERGCRLWVVHQFPWQNGAGRAIRSLEKIGKLLRVEFIFCSAGGDGLDANTLNEIVADILPHPLSVLGHLSLESDPGDLDWFVERDRAGELNATARCGDTRITIVISLASRPTECSMVLRGDQGSWHADFFHGYAWFEPGRVSRFDKTVAPFRKSACILGHASANLVSRAVRREFAYPGLKRLMREFYSGSVNEMTGQEQKTVISIATARDAIVEQTPLAAKSQRA